MHSVTILGCVFAVLLFLGRWQRGSLIALFILYLSLYHAGQTFLNFQWDTLLLECGFLAIFLVGGASNLLIFLFHFLLFRLRFMSGVSKLSSGDASWSNFTALNYYVETQPLPHVGSWYFQQLPEWMLRAGTGLLFYGIDYPVVYFLTQTISINSRWHNAVYAVAYYRHQQSYFCESTHHYPLRIFTQ